jgi:Leucine-rich repeat (LRR) protein
LGIYNGDELECISCSCSITDDQRFYKCRGCSELFCENCFTEENELCDTCFELENQVNIHYWCVPRSQTKSLSKFIGVKTSNRNLSSKKTVSKVLSVSNDIEIIDMSYLGITKINLAEIGKCYELEKLSLRGNNLHEINFSTTDDGKFDIKNLKTIDLSDNHFSSIDLSLLPDCNLENLDLSRNELTKIDLEPLEHYKGLRTLDLSQNSIDVVDLDPLSELTLLQKLNLSYNSIQNIDFSPLSKKAWLESLLVYNNPLKGVLLTPLEECPSLKTFLVDKDVILIENFIHPDIIPSAIRDVMDVIYKENSTTLIEYFNQIIDKKRDFLLSQKNYEKSLEKKNRTQFNEIINNLKPLMDNLVYEKTITETIVDLEEEEKEIQKTTTETIVDLEEEKEIKIRLKEKIRHKKYKVDETILLELPFENFGNKEEEFNISIQSPFGNPHPDQVIRIRPKTVKIYETILGHADRSYPPSPILVIIRDRNGVYDHNYKLSIEIKKTMGQHITSVLTAIVKKFS